MLAEASMPSLPLVVVLQLLEVEAGDSDAGGASPPLLLLLFSVVAVVDAVALMF